MTKPISFKFSFVDVNGDSIPDSGWKGSLGMGAKYSGTTSDTDALIQTIAAAYEGEDLSAEQQTLLRSFVVSWLESRRKKLGAVVEVATKLPSAVDYIARIGLLDRGVAAVAKGALVLGLVFIQVELLLESISSLSDLGSDQCALSASSQFAMEVASAGLDATLTARLAKFYGRPGEPLKRSAFDSATVLSFLKLCRFRSLIAQTGLDKPILDQMLVRLDDRIFVLFLANSRQLEGLKLSGKSEASAVVAAHAAIALSFQQCQPHDRDSIFKALQSRISLIKKPGKLNHTGQAEEAAATLATIEQNLSKELWQMELQLSRQLNNATASEAADLLAAPVSTAFDVLSYVATGVGKCCTGPSSKTLFEVAATGLKKASEVTDATPDAIASTVSGATDAESWVRSMLDKAWSTIRS